MTLTTNEALWVVFILGCSIGMSLAKIAEAIGVMLGRRWLRKRSTSRQPGEP